MMRKRETLSNEQGPPRRGSTVVGSFVALALLVGGPSVAPARSFALLVGVGQQPRATGAIEGHRPLKGTTNDVKNLRQLLMREYGFRPHDITALLDGEATLARVREEFVRLARDAGPDDLVVFHYAGHGTSIPDDNGDESASDPGDVMDEALCLYDCGGDMRRALRDDELGQRLDQLRAGQVVVILDCCHSGTATRSLDAAPRFGATRFLPARFDQEPRRPATPAPAGPVTRSSTGEIHRARTGQRRVVFSACTAVQQSCEIVPVPQLVDVHCGSLTYFLVEGLRGPADTDGNGKVSHLEAQRYALRRIDSLYNGAQELDRLRQTPLLAATPDTAAEEPAFGVDKKTPVHAVATPGIAAGSLRLDLGAIHGLKIGQRLALYPLVNGLPRLGDSVGDVEIQSLDAESAEAVLAAGAVGISGGLFAASPVVDPLAAPDVRLHLRAQRDDQGRVLPVANSLVVRLTGRIGEEPRVRLVQEAAELELMLEQQTVTGGQVKLTAVLLDESRREQRREPLVLETVVGLDQIEKIRFDDDAEKFLAGTMAWFRERIAEFRMRKLVGGLTNPAPGFRVQLVVNKKVNPGELMPEFPVGGRVKVGLKSTVDCWIHLLAIRPSGKIDVVYESSDRLPRLPANQRALFPGSEEYYQPSEPGVYQVKLIATRQQLAQPLVREGKLNPDELRTLSPANWSESSYAFRVARPR